MSGRSPYRKADPGAPVRSLSSELQAIMALPDSPTIMPMARPKTGRTPDKVRAAKSREELLKRGGRRVSVSLNPEASHALAVLSGEGWTFTEVIERALIAAAKGKRR